MPSIKADKWIKKMALEHRMIEPFEDRQVRDGVISYGLSSYGYDIRVADEVFKRRSKRVKYLVGTMIEVPRAAIVADEIAREAEFFSFGTNDLTQTVFGFSRDDAQAKFLKAYVERGIFKEDPFQVLDREGVGKIMQIATELGKRTRPDLEVGICGEHGGDPSSVEFCHQIGLDYVSCSPFRVPIARLAAAQARLRETMQVAKDV
jgi:pyruvate,orthophosphate dikinase